MSGSSLYIKLLLESEGGVYSSNSKSEGYVVRSGGIYSSVSGVSFDTNFGIGAGCLFCLMQSLVAII